MLLSKTKVLFIFFKKMIFFNILFTVSALLIYLLNESSHLFSFMFWTKVVGYAVAVYAVNWSKKEEFYFYYNQGISKRTLFIFTFLIDALIFGMLVMLMSLFI
jgi:hypothetical protein